MAFITLDGLKRVLNKIKTLLSNKADKSHSHMITDVTTTDGTALTDDNILTADKMASYNNKYTKSQVDEFLENITTGYISTVDVSTTASANKIPKSGTNGKLDPEWIDNTHLGSSVNTTGIITLNEPDLLIQAGRTESDNGDVLIYGGGLEQSSIVSTSASQSYIKVNGLNIDNINGSDLVIHAGNASQLTNSTGGNVVINSGEGRTDGYIKLNNISVTTDGDMYTSDMISISNIDEDNNEKHSIIIDEANFTIQNTNTLTDSSTYQLNIGWDGVVTGDINTANSFVITDNNNVISPNQLPTYDYYTDIGEITSTSYTINADECKKILKCTLSSNVTISISDSNTSTKYKEITLIIECNGDWAINWDSNIEFINDAYPNLADGKTVTVKLFKIGSDNWKGYEVGNIDNALVLDTDLPSDYIPSHTYTYVEETVEDEQ